MNKNQKLKTNYVITKINMKASLIFPTRVGEHGNIIKEKSVVGSWNLQMFV
jgi:hypothetical protein